MLIIWRFCSNIILDILFPSDTDSEVCSFTWQWCALAKGALPFFLTNNSCIPVKYTFGWSAVVFCACECSVWLELCSNIDFRPVINENRTMSYLDRDSCCWQDVFVFLQQSSRVLRNATHAVKVNCNLLIKTHYTVSCNQAVEQETHYKSLPFFVPGRGTFRRVCKIAVSDYELHHVCLSVRPSVRPLGTVVLPLNGFLWNLIFEYFLRNLFRKFRFHGNRTRINGTLLEDIFDHVSLNS